MALSTRRSEVNLQREMLIETTKEKLLVAIDEARQEFYAKKGQRRASKSATIPATHHYTISKVNSRSIAWDEEKVADISTILQNWSDRTLQLYCEGLDNQSLTVTVVEKMVEAPKARNSSERGEDENLHDLMRKRLHQRISSKIGHSIVPSQANGGLIEGIEHNFPVNVLKSDPSPPNLYAWEFSLKYPKFPSVDVSRWSVPQIEECNLALDEGHLKVRTVDATGSLIDTPEPRNRTARQKRADDTRLLLHKAIVAKLGREIHRRIASNNQINPIKDDPDAPNGYRWAFSSQYKSFPENKKLKDWTIDEHETCREAVEKGWLRVQLVVDQDDAHTSTHPNISDQPASSKTPVHREAPIVGNNASSMPESLPPTPPEKPLGDIQEELTLSQLKNIIGPTLETHIKSELLMKEMISRQTEEISQLKSQVEAFEQKIQLFQQGQNEDRDKIAQAREEGRHEGQDLAMRLMQETVLKSLRLHQASEKGSGDKNKAGGLEEEGRAKHHSNDTVPNVASQVLRSGGSYEDLSQATTTTNESNQEAQHKNTTRQGASSSKPSPSGFQAINKDPSLTSPTAGTKRVRPNDSSHDNHDSPEQSAAEEEDIYGATPLRKQARTVLDSVSFTTKKKIHEKWKSSVSGTGKEWQY